MYKWVIVSIEKNPHEKRADDDPRAIYSWTLKIDGSNWPTESAMHYREVELLLKHFGDSQPSELSGKKFESKHDDPSSALDYLITVVRNGGTYKAPTPEEIIEMAAQALGKGKMPDYSLVDNYSVFEAFQKAWGGDFEVDENWLKEFINRVNAIGSDYTYLVKSTSDGFNYRVMGPAVYMVLNVNGIFRQRLTLGPYSIPIQFDGKPEVSLLD